MVFYRQKYSKEGERMQLLTFMLNNVRFGIPVDDVESIETRMIVAVSYKHLRAHETEIHLVCRLML